MAHIMTDDGVRLHVEEAGSGDPIIFVHEFGGHHLCWEPQMRHFSRRYRAITYAARGWPPSDVPERVEAYSQARAADDVAAVMAGLKITRAHLVGLSMGATAVIEFAIRHPGKAATITAAAAGSGMSRDAASTQRFRDESREVARVIESEGIQTMAERYCDGPARRTLRHKDPRGWAEFKSQFAAGPALGRALTMRGIQATRVPFFERAAELAAVREPVLIIAGDEDDSTLDVSLYLKRTIPRCGLAMFPRTGHGINLEEPDGFNATVENFIAMATAGKWGASETTAGKNFSLLPPKP